MGVGVGVAGGTKVTQVPATVVVVVTEPEGETVVEPEVVAGLGLAPGVGLVLARGAGTALGPVEQVVTTVVTGFGFGVGVVLPIGAAVPPVDSVGLAEEVAEFEGDWLGLVIVDWLGMVGVVRLGGVMLL